MVPNTYQKILGIMLDFYHGFCSINPKKLAKFIDQVTDLLKKWKISLKDLQKIAGNGLFVDCFIF